MTDVSLLPAAESDYAEAFAWYHARSPRAAAGFEAAVDVALRSIASAPDRWPRCDEQHRFYILRRYPYSIIYRAVPDGALVVAVAHARRSPTYWHGRT